MTRLRAIVAVIAIGFAAACSRDDGEALRLAGWVSSPAEDEFVRQFVDTFTDQNPNLALRYHPIQANYPQKIQLMLGTGTAPDVFMLEAFWAPAMNSFGVLAPIDDLIAADPSYDIADFQPSLIDAFRHDGQLYGVPKDYSTLALFYNPEMLAAAGFDRPPRNWAELETYAAALTADTDGDGAIDRYGLGLDASLEYLLPFIWQNDGDILAPDGSLDLDNKGLLDALAWLQDLRRRDVIGLSTDVGSAWSMDGFGRGRFAMAMSGQWAVNFLAETFPDTPYRIAHLPEGRSRASIAYVVGYVMPADVADRQAAWRLMRHLTSIDGQTEWAESGVGLPPRRSIAAAAGLAADRDSAVFVESAAWARTWQLGPNQRLLDEAETALQAIFLIDTPVEEALARMQRRLEQE